MRRLSRAVQVVLLIVGMVASAALVQAQVSNFHLRRRGHRYTGAVVPGANLTLINPATGEKQVRDQQ